MLTHAAHFSEGSAIGQLKPVSPGKALGALARRHRRGADSAEFLTILATARAVGKPVAGEAIRERDAYGRWALRIYRPEPS